MFKPEVTVRVLRPALVLSGLAVCLTLGMNLRAFADSEAGFFVMGGGSESGGVYSTGAESESGGAMNSGSSSESGGATNSGAESESGGVFQTGAESGTGGVRAVGSETEADPTFGIRTYRW